MTPTERRWTGLTAVFGSIAVLTLLASSLMQLELKPGLPFEQIWAFLIGQFGGETSYSAFPPLGDGSGLATLYRIILYVALAGFIITVIMVLTSPEARRRVLRMIILILLLSVIFGTMVDSQQEELAIEYESTGVLPSAEEGQPVETPLDELKQPETPRWVSQAASLVLGLLLASVALSVALGYARARIERARLMARLAQQVNRAISDLEEGVDLRDAVLRCYAEMSRIASERRGARRESAVTASEFIASLERAGLPQDPVRQLTHLF